MREIQNVSFVVLFLFSYVHLKLFGEISFFDLCVYNLFEKLPRKSSSNTPHIQQLQYVIGWMICEIRFIVQFVK